MVGYGGCQNASFGAMVSKSQLTIVEGAEQFVTVSPLSQVQLLGVGVKSLSASQESGAVRDARQTKDVVIRNKLSQPQYVEGARRLWHW